jgi:hypothetical protein
MIWNIAQPSSQGLRTPKAGNQQQLTLRGEAVEVEVSKKTFK